MHGNVKNALLIIIGVLLYREESISLWGYRKCVATFMIISAVVCISSNCWCHASTCGPIEIYTLRGCPWCEKAKEEFYSRNLCFTEYEYVRGTGEPKKLPNGETPEAYPSIWVNGKNMGGYSEIASWIDTCKR